MRLTWRLADEIPKIKGLDIIVKPTMNVVGITSEAFDIRQVVQGLRQKGWAVALFPRHIRIVVMPHIQKEHVDDFLEDLKSVTDRLRG